MVVLALPKYAVFKNKFNSKYLSYRKDDKYLSFTGDNVQSPESKFAIEPESNGSTGRVHVRSCYHNRYLVQNSSQFLIADAAKPDEDTTKETCTLLEPVKVNDTTIRFRHVKSRNYACLFHAPDEPNNTFLCAMWTVADSALTDAYEVIDWESLVIFPTCDIAFKGSNGSYLEGFTHSNNCHHQRFSSGDKNKKAASYRVEPVGDGSVQIYSYNFTSYWSTINGWVVSERKEKSPNDPTELFWPIKLSSDVIALRSLDNNKFLYRYISDGAARQWLITDGETITDDCHITVEELVMSRSIYNIVYRKEDASVYNEIPIVCGKAAATNNSDEEYTMEIPIRYTEAKSTRWGNSVSLEEVPTSTTLETGVPLIVEGEIDFSVPVTGGHTWGGTKDESFEAGVTYITTIKPKTQVEVSYIATKGTCDIPFWYTQSVTCFDGTHKITVKSDGMYTGVNCYNYHFVKKETRVSVKKETQEITVKNDGVCVYRAID